MPVRLRGINVTAAMRFETRYVTRAANLAIRDTLGARLNPVGSRALLRLPIPATSFRH